MTPQQVAATIDAKHTDTFTPYALNVPDPAALARQAAALAALAKETRS